jgi:hypothetical protein
MVSDVSLDELHAFAATLDIPQRGFHRDHYDLPEMYREQAVALGAVEVTSRELLRRMRAAGLRVQKSRDTSLGPVA